MKVTFGQQTTKVKQLADLLSQEISMGKYKSNCTLPSINKLSREYQVSRDTVFKAFIDLKDRGIIDSTPGKGYYVTNKLTNILLLLDEYSPFKYSLYNSFIKKLSINYKVDLLFHQYNETTKSIEFKLNGDKGWFLSVAQSAKDGTKQNISIPISREEGYALGIMLRAALPLIHNLF